MFEIGHYASVAGAGLSEELIGALVKRARSDSPRDEIFRPQGFKKPLSRRNLVRAEKSLGFRLPQAVRDVYGRVANGGFGPGYGIIGLVGGFLSDTKKDVVGEYTMLREDGHLSNEPEWPEALLPICHWGCGIYSCVDCSDARARIVRFDPNPVDEDWSIAWGDENYTLEGWLTAWRDGAELFASGTPPNAYPGA